MKVIAWPAFKTRYKNPYTWLLYSNMPESVAVSEFSMSRFLWERFDVLHLHWPVETLVRHPSIWVARLRVVTFWLLLKWSRLRGTKIVWTIHDEKPHVVLHERLADWFQARLIANVDGYINLCTAGKKAVEKAMAGLDEKPGFVVAHGHYRGCYADNVSWEEARSHFNLSADTKVLLYFGYISPYKNVPHLIDTFQQIPFQEKNITLLVAGRPDDAVIETTVRSAAGENDNIQLHLRFIKDEELQLFFRAADLVVLPFTEILNSGSLLLSLSFDRSVLAPNMGAVSDWQKQLGSGWIKTYDGELKADVLMAAVEDCARERGQAPIEFLDWETIAQQTVLAYEAVGVDSAALSPQLMSSSKEAV